MDLEQGNIYHLFNQGNNHEKIFFTKANYSYFLKKIEQHIFPMADILVWCLMPNHFHLIIALSAEKSCRISEQVIQSSQFTLNSSIAVMLRSYTRAINIQEHRSGSLFRERTKAILLGSLESEKLKHQNSIKPENSGALNSEEEYLQTCFRDIHHNPVKAGLVIKDADWEFSSARDFAGMKNESLINKQLAEELGLKISSE